MYMNINLIPIAILKFPAVFKPFLLGDCKFDLHHLGDPTLADVVGRGTRGGGEASNTLRNVYMIKGA